MARTVCRRRMRIPADAIFAEMLDLARWPSFRGYGPIPGIRAARFRERTAGVVGSRIEVENLDGSSHVEEIVTWDPPREIEMRMSEFTPPLAALATHTVETWRFEPAPGGGCVAERRFELHPKGWRGRVVLPVIAWLLGRASARHLREMDGARPAGRAA